MSKGTGERVVEKNLNSNADLKLAQPEVIMPCKTGWQTDKKQKKQLESVWNLEKMVGIGCQGDHLPRPKDHSRNETVLL